jgi:hypothetical protein
VRAHPWLLLATIAIGAFVGCSDDDGGSTSPSTVRAAGWTTAPAPVPTSAPPAGAACELVTRSDAEAVFGAPARPAPPLGGGGDAVCTWAAGNGAGGPSQTLEFELHEGSGVSTYAAGNARVSISVQRSVNGRGFAFTYLGEGGDADAKRAAVNELAERVIARSE